MKRLLWIALVVAAVGYGWHQADLQRARGTHEVVVVNHTGRMLGRVRVEVGGQRCEFDSLANGATRRQPLRCRRDGTFEVTWTARDDAADHHWSGGSFTQGPLPMRHRFEFLGGDGVVWSSGRKPATR